MISCDFSLPGGHRHVEREQQSRHLQELPSPGCAGRAFERPRERCCAALRGVHCADGGAGANGHPEPMSKGAGQQARCEGESQAQGREIVSWHFLAILGWLLAGCQDFELFRFGMPWKGLHLYDFVRFCMTLYHTIIYYCIKTY